MSPEELLKKARHALIMARVYVDLERCPMNTLTVIDGTVRAIDEHLHGPEDAGPDGPNIGLTLEDIEQGKYPESL